MCAWFVWIENAKDEREKNYDITEVKKYFSLIFSSKFKNILLIWQELLQFRDKLFLLIKKMKQKLKKQET